MSGRKGLTDGRARLKMPNSQCLSLGGKRLIKWQSSDFEVMMEDQHSEKEVDESVCELEISGGKADRLFVLSLIHI